MLLLENEHGGGVGEPALFLIRWKAWLRRESVRIAIVYSSRKSTLRLSGEKESAEDVGIVYKEVVLGLRELREAMTTARTL